MITVECPSCRKSFSPPPGSAGSSIRCSCGRSFVIMKAPSASEPPTRTHVPEIKPSAAQSLIASVPGAVRFTPKSQDEIRAEAERQLKEKSRAEASLSADATYQAGFCGCIVSLACLLIPVVGIFICIIGVPASILFMLGGGSLGIAALFKGANPQEVLGLSYKLRNMAGGNCPICHSEIWIATLTDVADIACPTCSGPLHYDKGMVSPQ